MWKPVENEKAGGKRRVCRSSWLIPVGAGYSAGVADEAPFHKKSSKNAVLSPFTVAGTSRMP